jgi:hypothetical protein
MCILDLYYKQTVNMEAKKELREASARGRRGHGGWRGRAGLSGGVRGKSDRQPRGLEWIHLQNDVRRLLGIRPEASFRLADQVSFPGI